MTEQNKTESGHGRNGAIEYAGLTDRGRVRDRNEDAWFADSGEGLFFVCDGLGGHRGGELASEITVKTLPGMLKQRMENVKDLGDPLAASHVSAALVELSSQVYRSGRQNPTVRGMGATIVVALIRDDKALISHLGDSRAYIFREKQMEPLTKDHSIVQLLIDEGEITPKQARTHPSRSQITRYIGMEEETPPDTSVIDLKGGDRLLLCSDGLSDMVPDEKIAGFLRKVAKPRIICRYLVDEANALGGDDNITVALIDWHG